MATEPDRTAAILRELVTRLLDLDAQLAGLARLYRPGDRLRAAEVSDEFARLRADEVAPIGALVAELVDRPPTDRVTTGDAVTVQIHRQPDDPDARVAAALAFAAQCVETRGVSMPPGQLLQAFLQHERRWGRG